MCSRKNKTRSRKNAPDPRTNGDDLRRALAWIVNDQMFANLRLHGNIDWTGASLVRLAVFWVWSSECSLVDAANDAIACVTRVFGNSAVASYQALTNALHRYSSQLLPILEAGGRPIALTDVHVHELLLVLFWLQDAWREYQKPVVSGHGPKFHEAKLQSLFRRTAS